MRVGGYVGDNEYEEDEDEDEPLAVGKATVSYSLSLINIYPQYAFYYYPSCLYHPISLIPSVKVAWIYPNSMENTVEVKDLLVLDRSFAFGGTVALKSDPINSLGFVMKNDSRYDVRVLGT